MAVKYAICGLSNRGIANFVLPLLGTTGGRDTVLGYGSNTENFSAHGELVAVVDPDRERAEDFVARLVPDTAPPVAIYSPDDFDRMVQETAAERVIVASPDDSHETYILAALERGLDVVAEKPMVTTAAGAARVLAAERRSAGTVLVTHNLRYTARHRQIKQLLLDGAIGRIVHVSLDYFVDVRHGASYFLRWNRERARSGGLSVHKSTHHLDLVSWWLAAEPRQVHALGGRSFYGPDSPHRPRTAGGQWAQGDELRELDPYFRAQQGSGALTPDARQARTGLYDLPYHHQYPAGRDDYLYDDAIDVEDHYAALIGYDGGASVSYSINFSAPWEGYRLIITGTHGQLETQTGRTPQGEPLPGTDRLILRPLFEEPQVLSIEQVLGGHEGADPLLRHDVFVGPTEESTRLGLVASSREGAVAVAAGEAIWRSIEQGGPVNVQDLLRTS
ncbi:Gfo/Idh/MocA family protein [Georgenia sp. MJ170]|uniref:Gfo/Idh/MocA family protein n=1 Tax=Georgenia sunbinii TaxID=3117728 RepID=UPI002F26AFB3